MLSQGVAALFYSRLPLGFLESASGALFYGFRRIPCSFFPASARLRLAA
jgi:hypothetical protein